jgi:uncharacterized tellurite resistance protein B-like protein
MHIVLAILGLLGGGLFWWYRLKVLSEAAGDVVDSMGRVRGYFRRRKIRQQATHFPLTAIEDPVLAAATVIFALIAEDTLITENHFDAVRSVLIDVSNPRKADEAMIYAKWAITQIGDTATIIEKTSPLRRRQLNDLEKCELIDMIGAAAAAVPVSHHYGQRIRKLKQRLGLQVD